VTLQRIQIIQNPDDCLSEMNGAQVDSHSVSNRRRGIGSGLLWINPTQITTIQSGFAANYKLQIRLRYLFQFSNPVIAANGESQTTPQFVKNCKLLCLGLTSAALFKSQNERQGDHSPRCTPTDSPILSQKKEHARK
jgi:hypothetical protein